MKRLSILILAAGLGFSGCKAKTASSSGDAGPVTPQNPAATTSTKTYTTELKPGNEVPAISGPESGVSGTATISLKTTMDGAGVVTAATADFTVALSGFPAGSSVTMAHIHSGGSTAVGGILVDTGVSAGSVTLSGGAGSFTRNGVSVPASVAQGMLNDPSRYYFNVHSAMNSGGVVRGQVDGSGAPADPANPMPDPDDPYPYPLGRH